MSDEGIIEVVSALKANDKTMKDNGISDNLWGKAVECIMFLQSENAALRERLDRAIELPFFQKDGEAIVLIYKNKDGVVLTETYFEDEYYDGKRGNEAAEARLAELKGEKDENL